MSKIIVTETDFCTLVWCDAAGNERTTTHPAAGRLAVEDRPTDKNPENTEKTAQRPPAVLDPAGNPIRYAARLGQIPSAFAAALNGKLMGYDEYILERNSRLEQTARTTTPPITVTTEGRRLASLMLARGHEEAEARGNNRSDAPTMYTRPLLGRWVRLGSFSGPTDGAATAAEAMKLAAKGTQTETIDDAERTGGVS